MAEFDYLKYKEIRSTTYVLCTIGAVLAIRANFVKFIEDKTARFAGNLILHGLILVILIYLFNTYREQSGKQFKMFTRYTVLGVVVTLTVMFVNIYMPADVYEKVQVGRIRQSSATTLISFGQAAVIALPMIEFMKIRNIVTPPEKPFATTTPYMKEEDKE